MFKLNNIYGKMSSDEGAAGSTETIMLVALALFLVFAIFKYIVGPIRDKSKEIGKAIETM